MHPLFSICLFDLWRSSLLSICPWLRINLGERHLTKLENATITQILSSNGLHYRRKWQTVKSGNAGAQGSEDDRILIHLFFLFFFFPKTTSALVLSRCRIVSTIRHLLCVHALLFRFILAGCRSSHPKIISFLCPPLSTYL